MAIDIIKERKIIAIVRGLPSEQLGPLVEALWLGGVGLVEVTFAQQAPDTWRDTAAGIRMIARDYAGRVLPGAGTVVSLEQLQLAWEAGAQYIISPNADEEIIHATKALGLVSIPGAMTATEIVRAHRAGADLVKVFPADSLGPGYIKAIRAPLAHIPLMVVGGVNERNAAAFMRAGAAGLGVGGSLIRKDWVAAGQWDRITDLARAYTNAVRE